MREDEIEDANGTVRTRRKEKIIAPLRGTPNGVREGCPFGVHCREPRNTSLQRHPKLGVVGLRTDEVRYQYA